MLPMRKLEHIVAERRILLKRVIPGVLSVGRCATTIATPRCNLNIRERCRHGDPYIASFVIASSVRMVRPIQGPELLMSLPPDWTNIPPSLGGFKGY